MNTLLLDETTGFKASEQDGLIPLWEISLPIEFSDFWLSLYCDRILLLLNQWNLTKAEILFQGSDRPHIISTKELESNMSFSAPTPPDLISSHKNTGISIGNHTLSPSLVRSLSKMYDSGIPQGLLQPDGLQLWINPVALSLFGLPHISHAIGRDTTRDWYPPDRQNRKVVIRDMGLVEQFLTAHIFVNGGWRKCDFSYQFADDHSLIVASILYSEPVSNPQLVH